MGLIVPAVLASSYKEIEEKLALLSRIPSVSRVQVDVVDGIFAEPASWPYTAAKEFRTMVERGEMLPHLDKLAYEIDLMCINAEKMAGAWLALGASRLTFHAESSTDFPRLIAFSKKCYGEEVVSFGCAINIASDLSIIEPCLGGIEYVQFMGIAKIGRQGQLFDKRVLGKISAFRAQHPNFAIQVDGGVSLENAKELIKLGVSNLIIGSAILRANNPSAVIAEFESLQTPYGV